MREINPYRKCFALLVKIFYGSVYLIERYQNLHSEAFYSVNQKWRYTTLVNENVYWHTIDNLVCVLAFINSF